MKEALQNFIFITIIIKNHTLHFLFCCLKSSNKFFFSAHLPLPANMDLLLPLQYGPTPPYANTGLLPYANTGLLPYANTGLLPYANTGLLPYANTGLLPYANTGLLPYANTDLLRFTQEYNKEAYFEIDGTEVESPTSRSITRIFVANKNTGKGMKDNVRANLTFVDYEQSLCQLEPLKKEMKTIRSDHHNL